MKMFLIKLSNCFDQIEGKVFSSVSYLAAELKKLYRKTTVDGLSTCHVVLNLRFKKGLQMTC